MNDLVYLSAREAAAELGVQPATLYSYVSRGLVQSVPGPGKQRRYAAEDIRRLKGQRDVAGPMPTGSLSGLKILESRLTLITDQGPWYRGHAATELAKSFSLEAVATLLWECKTDPFSKKAPEMMIKLPDGLGPLERLMMAIAAWPLQEKAAYTRSQDLLRQQGAGLLRLGVSALLGCDQVDDLPVHKQIARAWSVSKPDDVDLLRATLVLVADHELNTSAFAVRCAASTRAPLHAALISGFGAFTGTRHGAHSDRVSAWLANIETVDQVEPVFQKMLMRGETLPGFGHSIYEYADPRALFLLSQISNTAENDQASELVEAICRLAADLFGLYPNVDLALALVQKRLELPDHAGKVLFCAGRMVGWIAHALEQYLEPEQIRPRASYIGERPRGGT